MKHLGDITKINWDEVEPVDCVTGGSPCQDLSIAGKRAGLAGERSGLYMEQIRCVKELRKASGRTGKIRPRYMVWENVPGAFSSNGGKDFAAVLEEAVKIVEPEAPSIPAPAKWPGSGCLMGGGWSIAWRVHDAQFWGVPQRRKRIALVCDFGGHTAPEILFERKGLRGDTAESGTAREGIAGDAESSTDKAVVCLQGNGIDRPDTANCNGRGWCENVSYTLNTIDRPAVCAGFKLGNGERSRSIGYEEELSPTLNAECGGNKPAVMSVAYGVGNGQVHEAATMAQEVSQTLNTMHDAQAVMCSAIDCRNFTEGGEINGTLQAKGSGGQSINLQNTVRQNMMVRRLTPLEYERLQGYPDGWTDIGKWIDDNGKKHRSSDSSRYIALGNSIALPFWFWLLRRISAQYERPATLGSLFDGIGGFPLCWERCNGEGTALWASEIEEFPMAVTKMRFGRKEE